MASPPLTLPDARLADLIAALMERFKIRAILRELNSQHDDLGEVIAELDLVQPVEGEISDEDQEAIDEAESLLEAFRVAESDMRGGRADEARHLLYMRLPYGLRDIFHPETGLKAR